MRLVYHLGCSSLEEPCAVHRIFDREGAPPAIDTTPVDDIGDSAVLLRLRVEDQTLVSLRVQRGDDVYTFNAADAPDTSDRLITIAKAVLGATANGF